MTKVHFFPLKGEWQVESLPVPPAIKGITASGHILI